MTDMDDKGIYIKDINDGVMVEGIFLVKEITLPVAFDTGMKVTDYFIVPEFAVFVIPAAVFIEPENGFIFTNNNFFDLFRHTQEFTGSNVR